MLKSLELRNFESHQKTKLEFSSGVNILIGNSDSGKTAVLRALRWVLVNRPLGSEIISWEGVSDGQDTSVTIITDTDTIVRSKGKQEEYKLNDLEFHAFKTDVPEEIIRALNMNSTNAKTQFESHFLLSSSPGEVASFFNKIARLDKIDLATSNINKSITGIKSTIAFKTGEIEKNEVKLLTYDYLVEFEKSVGDLEIDKIALELLQTKREQLSELIEEAKVIEASIANEQQMLLIEPLLNTILSDMKEREDIAQKADKLDALIQESERIQVNLDKYTSVLSVELLVISLLKLYTDKKDAETERNRLSSLIRNATNIDSQLKLAEDNYKKLHKQFDDEFPERCPLCNKPK